MSVVIVLDCGATNIRAIAVSDNGQILASHYIKNNTQLSGSENQYHVWDFAEIWSKLVRCCAAVTSQLDAEQIVAVTVTTFGVDGAPYSKSAQQIYPIISWKCPRTVPVMSQVETETDRLASTKVMGLATTVSIRSTSFVGLKITSRRSINRWTSLCSFPRC